MDCVRINSLVLQAKRVDFLQYYLSSYLYLHPTEKDLEELKQSFENRIERIKQEAETTIADAKIEAQKVMASVKSLYENQVTLLEPSLFRFEYLKSCVAKFIKDPSKWERHLTE